MHPQKAQNLYRNCATESRAGVKEQKPPARGGFTPSKQPAGRSLFEAQERIPTSAEVGSRLCLENPQTLKSLIKLYRYFFDKN